MSIVFTLTFITVTFFVYDLSKEFDFKQQEIDKNNRDIETDPEIHLKFESDNNEETNFFLKNQNTTNVKEEAKTRIQVLNLIIQQSDRLDFNILLYSIVHIVRFRYTPFTDSIQLFQF